MNNKQFYALVSGCGSVSRAVTLHSRGLRFKSSNWQNYIENFTVSWIEKTQTEKIEAGIGPFKKQS